MIGIELWSLFRQFGHPNKFRLIHRLYDGPKTGTELASDTGLSSSTVRSNMKSLKSSGFVTNIKEDGDRRYTLDLPLPSFVHELMLILVLLTEAPPARVAKDSSDPPLEADRQHLLRNLENELLSREIEAFFAQLFKPRGIRQRLRDLNELEREVDSIRASIDRIRNKTDSDPN